MSAYSDKGIEILKVHGKAMLSELVDQVAGPALEEAVKKSATPFDDVMLAALEPALKQALKDAIAKI